MRKSATIFSNCPFEESPAVKSLPGPRPIPEHVEEPLSTQTKGNPPTIMFADESTRGALNKVVLPNFLLRPPFGMPRFKDVITLKRLGNSPQARMAKQTIIDEVVSIPWSIKPKDKTITEISDDLQTKIDEPTNFLENPNTRGDSFEWLLRAMLEDLLNYDSGIWVKEFDDSESMVELVVADGRTFLKNPNIHGKFEGRDDIIPEGGIELNQQTRSQLGGIDNATTFNTPVGLTIEQAKNRAAYFQFGFVTSSRPIAFGRKEIVWFEKNPQTDQIYGKGPIESILDVLQTLIYSIEYHLDYFEDNNVPKGFINMPGAEEEDMESFRDKWNEMQLKVNSSGFVKKNFHRIPMSNTENASFVPIQFSAREMQLIEEQAWFSKLVWATFGVTPSELGFTEDSNLATEINQSRVFKRKAILPLLRIIEHRINNDILSEWDFHKDIVFEFNTFDVEDEKKKWELYDLQIRTGAITKNEVRIKEGLEELEEEDLEEEVQDVSNLGEEDKKPKDPKEKESLSRAEKKAVDFDAVGSGIVNLLKQKEKEILKALRMEALGDRLTQIKSFRSLLTRIGEILNLDQFKSLIDKATESLFLKGGETVDEFVKNEGIVTQSTFANQNQIAFLAETTFGNIKGMEADLENKLKQQLRIGIVNGEGITKMTERVKSVFDFSEARARTIARTEAARVENAGSLQTAKDFEKDGIDLKKWILITNDDRTTEVSKAMDRKYGSEEKAIPLNENFSVKVGGKEFSGQFPPFMPNDRDVIVYMVVKSSRQTP